MSDLDIHVIDFQSASAPAAFTESLKNTGFAVIKNHPINIELVNAVYDEWKISILCFKVELIIMFIV